MGVINQSEYVNFYLKQEELKRIRGLIDQKKMSCIPLRIYFKRGRAKVEIALGVGKTKGDKRQTLKKKARYETNGESLEKAKTDHKESILF